MNDPAAMLGAIAGAAAAVFAAFGVWQNREQRRRDLAADRPLLDASTRNAEGLVLVDLRSVRPAPPPVWEIERVQSLRPERALLLRSEWTMPQGPPSPEIEPRFVLTDNAAAPRFFVALHGPPTRSPIELRLHFRRDGGERFTKSIKVALPMPIAPGA